MALSMDRPSLGASGGVFGLLAAGVVVGWKYWEAIPVRARKYFGGALAWYIGYSLLSGLRSEGTDNWSHLGGLLGGGLIMTLLEPQVFAARARANRIVRGSIIALLGLIMLGLNLAGPKLVPLAPQEQDGWTLARPVYWKEGWTFTGDRGWFSPTLQANLSAATIVHARPLSAEEAAKKLVDRVSSGGRNTTVLTDQAKQVDGWDARLITLRFALADEPQTITALVLTRGVYEHRVQFQVLANQAQRQAVLARRVMESVQLSEPPDLIIARRKALTHPRSWEPAAELGEALYKAGAPEPALAEFDRARTIAPSHSRPIIGSLRVYADYQLPGAAAAGAQALVDFPDDPDVIVAAADALEAAGDERATVDALDAAWLRLPGDGTLRRARLQRGLAVELNDLDE